MIACHLPQLDSDKTLRIRYGAEIGRFCLVQHLEKTPVTLRDTIDFMSDHGLQIERFWAGRFVEHSNGTLAFQEMRC